MVPDTLAIVGVTPPPLVYIYFPASFAVDNTAEPVVAVRVDADHVVPEKVADAPVLKFAMVADVTVAITPRMTPA